MDEGWRLGFTDSTGREVRVTTEDYSQNKFHEDITYGAYTFTTSLVADFERLAMALVLEPEEAHMVAKASDSVVAIHTLRNISQGIPKRSEIEQHLKDTLRD